MEAQEVLLPCYSPCSNFGLCKEAVWDPAAGHVPRGFLGATGSAEDVEVIMVFAEPGGAYPHDAFVSGLSEDEFLREAVEDTYRAFSQGTDLFHRNVRWFLDQLYPARSFDEQLQYVLLTEGRLCSIASEIGSTTDPRCAHNYLKKQISLFPNATIVGLGGKAQKYLRSLKVDHLAAYAMAPPGANHRPARPSWEAVIEGIRAMRQ